MFEGLDDFLSGPSDFHVNVPAPQFDTGPQDDSLNLNDSIFNTIPSKNKRSNKNGETKSEKKEMGKEEKTIVLSRTQKIALKRLDKIKAKMAVQMMDSPQLTSETDKKQSRRSRAPPKERKAPTGRGRSRRARYVHIEDDDSEYDSDGVILPSNYNRPTNNHDIETIVLDCDDIFKGGPSVQITRDLAGASSCITDDDIELQVSVLVSGKVNKYKMRRYQKFTELVSQISESESIPVNQIVLMFKDKTFATSESPESIGYIQGFVIKAHLTSATAKPIPISSTNDKKDKIEIKIQTSSRKKPFIVYIGKADTLAKLAYEVAEEFKCDAKKVRLEFDGDMVNFNDTPDDMELEGGEMLDFFLAK